MPFWLRKHLLRLY